ncbi:MAG TPA: aminoacyl-tRNA hydrolase [Candidatus Binatia bacterium]|nr:aminoacyl-tRNA hydrolase [Candidatus Binatia bacterium]
MWVLVGLGNPGARYRRTRHNVGFRVLDTVAARFGVEIAREAHQALLAETRRDGERVLLVKPQTFMNLSGNAVGSLARYYRFPLDRLLVVHDDVDLPVGRLKLRAGGGTGGHRGIESLTAALGDPGFLRLKVGVGRPPAGRTAVEWVLAPATGEEAERLGAAEERAAGALELVLAEGPAHAMNRINQREAVHGGSPL